jgi:hypothetical protein
MSFQYTWASLIAPNQIAETSGLGAYVPLGARGRSADRNRRACGACTVIDELGAAGSA